MNLIGRQRYFLRLIACGFFLLSYSLKVIANDSRGGVDTEETEMFLAFEPSIVGEKPSSFYRANAPIQFFMGACHTGGEQIGCPGLDYSFELGTVIEVLNSRKMVRLSKSFEIQKTEVTQLQYYLVMKESEVAKNPNPSHFNWEKHCPGENIFTDDGYFLCPQNPVEGVTWIDAKNFVARLNFCPEISYHGIDTKQDAEEFREKLAELDRCFDKRYESGEMVYDLPTEAEWEFAARGGKDEPRFFDSLITKWEFSFPNTEEEYKSQEYKDLLNMHAWWYYNSDGKTHPVASKKPNSYDLYDVFGNVSEWVNEWSGDWLEKNNESGIRMTDPKRRPELKGDSEDGYYYSAILKGGSLYTYSKNFHVSETYSLNPNFERSSNGFRVVRRKKSWTQGVSFDQENEGAPRSKSKRIKLKLNK